MRSRNVIQIDITNEQSRLPIDEQRLRAAVAAVLAGEGRSAATISVAVVDDPTIHELNRRFLAHDYPTDVLSFVLEESTAGLEGEIIVSADTAAASAPRYGWPATDELLLYVIHGTLHLVGYNDHEPADIARMRAAEKRYLAQCGLQAQDDSASSRPDRSGREPQLLGEGNQP
ncbi:MAG TPA: rRNA maturation RNase YbeY [Pirellulales bacterium]|nr:rRNA maturation RNase YbeY [Pirellulales bacterium]